MSRGREQFQPGRRVHFSFKELQGMNPNYLRRYSGRHTVLSSAEEQMVYPYDLSSPNWIVLGGDFLRHSLQNGHSVKPEKDFSLKIEPGILTFANTLTINSRGGQRLDYPLSYVMAFSRHGENLVVFWSTPDGEIVSTPHPNSQAIIRNKIP